MSLVQVLLHSYSWISLPLQGGLLWTARELAYYSASVQTDLKASTD